MLRLVSTGTVQITFHYTDAMFVICPRRRREMPRHGRHVTVVGRGGYIVQGGERKHTFAAVNAIGLLDISPLHVVTDDKDERFIGAGQCVYALRSFVSVE